MRYIGGKGQIIENILEVMRMHTQSVHTITDIFSGSGIVARTFKKEGYSVNANDLLYFSYVLNRGLLCNNRTTKRIREILHHLNTLSARNADSTNPTNFIAYNYSPNGTCNRMYFQQENALKIDLIRQEIERLRGQITENEYFYLLASLLSAVPYVANITGTFAAYLKYWDVRTYKPLTLEELPVIPSKERCRVFNMSADELAGHIRSDLVYLDPPYNAREYLPNYHILETIARYDNPEIRGVTGMRAENDCKSDFCRKNSVHQAFDNLLENLNCRYVIISYNNEGLLSTEELADIIQAHGRRDTFHLYEFPYRRYKNKIPNNTEGLKEQLYFIQCRE